MSKIFVIGLPRTGTTSLCAYLLEQDLKVAHTAYTKESFYLADVIADTPVYCDYPQLDVLFPQSRFILLTRDLNLWGPSIEKLLNKVAPRFGTTKKGVNPIIERCLKTVFPGLSETSVPSQTQLMEMYHYHEAGVLRYFRDRPEQLLTIDLSDQTSVERLNLFLSLSYAVELPNLNQNGTISDWDKLKHPGKVSSHAAGTSGRRYFTF